MNKSNKCEICLTASSGECELMDEFLAVLKKVEELEADRDRWKERAEALERGINKKGRP